jgi:monoamine oxidase
VERVESDVCVVGAGFSGLTAALRLRQAGLEVVVLEARERVGGRTWTIELDDGTWIDKGGAWFGPGQNRAYALAEEMGVGTYRTFNDGQHVYIWEGKPHRYSGLIPLRMGLLALANLGLVMRRIDGFGKKVPLDAPWDAVKAAEWDATSVGDWMRGKLRSRTAHRGLWQVVNDLFADDPANVSLLHLAYLSHSHDGLESLSSIEGGNQQDRVVGGMQAIANAVHARLGDAVKLDSAVSEIREVNGRIEVGTGATAVNASRAVVALQPGLAARIAFDPPLSDERMGAQKAAQGGAVHKVALVYADAWWRDEGLTGQSLHLGSPASITLDACTDESSPGILNTFISGPASTAYGRLPEDERRTLVIETMVERFGPKARDVEHYLEQDWGGEEFTTGCSYAHLGLGGLTRYGRLLSEPAGLLHWACAESAAITHGGIDGAIRSGERAAAEVLAAS